MSISPRSAGRDRDRVGPYVLVKAIGAGGSARVDLARIERAYGFQRHVVIKRPLEHLRSDPRAAESIRREARLGARLRHPNLISILDAGVHDGYDYLVLDYIHGAALRLLMQTDEASRVRDVSLEVALTIVRDVARGVHDAHELKDEHGAPLGLVHRDVSPGNVLVGLDGAVKLADFGIAKETRVATLSGSMHGTVTYMAPEQCRGHAFDRRADVFSLGVILYELVTGTRLFWADNDVASLHRVLAGTITRPRKVRPGISPELEELVMTAVAPDQDRRFPTARAFADAVETFAIENGHILVARAVARCMAEMLGPRDAPWIGENTVIDLAPVAPAFSPDERLPPLVGVIELSPGYELPPTFGPTDATVIEELSTPERALPPERPVRRRRGALVLGASLAIGGIIAFAATRGDERTAGSPLAAPGAGNGDPSGVVVKAPPGGGTPAIDGGIAEEPDGTGEEEGIEIEDPDDRVASGSRPTKPTKRQRTRKKREKADTAKANAGSTKTGATKVQWDPTLLMPTDSANKKQR